MFDWSASARHRLPPGHRTGTVAESPEVIRRLAAALGAQSRRAGGPKSLETAARALDQSANWPSGHRSLQRRSPPELPPAAAALRICRTLPERLHSIAACLKPRRIDAELVAGRTLLALSWGMHGDSRQPLQASAFVATGQPKLSAKSGCVTARVMWT